MHLHYEYIYKIQSDYKLASRTARKLTGKYQVAVLEINEDRMVTTTNGILTLNRKFFNVVYIRDDLKNISILICKLIW